MSTVNGGDTSEIVKSGKNDEKTDNKFEQMFGQGEYINTVIVYKNDTPSSTSFLSSEFVNPQEYINRVIDVVAGNTTIVSKCSVFESKLGGIPTSLMHLPMPKNLGLRHEYIVLELEREMPSDHPLGSTRLDTEYKMLCYV